MAKKKSAKKAAPAPQKTKKAPPKKQAEQDEPVAIELDAVEEKALEMVQSSQPLCDDLEAEVTDAVSAAVRKVFKKHGHALSSEQAANVAMVLFGDE
jgi:hypothetical protein